MLLINVKNNTRSGLLRIKKSTSFIGELVIVTNGRSITLNLEYLYVSIRTMKGVSQSSKETLLNYRKRSNESLSESATEQAMQSSVNRNRFMNTQDTVSTLGFGPMNSNSVTGQGVNNHFSNTTDTVLNASSSTPATIISGGTTATNSQISQLNGTNESRLNTITMEGRFIIDRQHLMVNRLTFIYSEMKKRIEKNEPGIAEMSATALGVDSETMQVFGKKCADVVAVSDRALEQIAAQKK